MATSMQRAMLMLLALGVGAYWEWQAAELPKESRGRSVVQQEGWVLPRLPVRQSQQAMDILTQASLWGKLPESTDQTPLTPPGWRFFGSYSTGAERYLLIKPDNQPEYALKVGDQLPGGSKILRIEQDSICILLKGKQRKLYIIARGPEDL